MRIRREAKGQRAEQMEDEQAICMLDGRVSNHL
jgi:hypothetical protein